MSTIAAPLLVAFTLSLLLVRLCQRLAFRVGCVARPREDRWHKQPTPLFGGVAISLTLFAVVAAFGHAREVAVLAGSAAAIFIVGLVDDIITLKPSTKLIAQIALASVLLFFGFRLNWLDSITLDSLLTLLWVVGITNAFNLLDNMDGLCAGIAVIVGTALLIDMLTGVSSGTVDAQVVYLAALLGATAGFLVYNFNPASIFMGDSGSLMLGFSFAALTLTTPDTTAAPSNVLSIVAAPVFVLLIPIFDTTLVTVMRKLSGRSASMGGRDHSSHRLVAIGLSERTAVGVMWLVAAMGGAVALTMKFADVSWSLPAAVLFLVGMGLFAVYLARIRVYEPDERFVPESRVTPIVVEFMYKRRVAEILLDFCLIAIGYYLAYRLRFEDPEQFQREFANFVTSLPVVLASTLIAFFAVGVYRGAWRYFGMMDAVAIVKGVLLGTFAAQLLILYVYHFFSYSRTVFVIYAVLVAGLVMLSRASFRLVGEFVLRQRSAGRRVLIYGAGDGAALAVSQLREHESTIKILGFIDEDQKNRRSRVAGYPVLGDFPALEVLVSTGSVDLVVITPRLLDAQRLAQLATLCDEHGVALARLHVGLEELVAPARATPARPRPASDLRQAGG
jgi:UDP-GlcNAc:undecaprenyl-phosphate/decaprenyl-phosphate GlcNAc-1-phosphate transferase